MQKANDKIWKTFQTQVIIVNEEVDKLSISQIASKRREKQGQKDLLLRAETCV